MSFNFSVTSPSEFGATADLILNKCLLCVKNKEFRICEIEFYLRNKEHDDSYVHCSDDQLTKGKWYFHKYKTGSFKGGTYKGMDITFGNEKDSFCGVLVRSIYDQDSDVFTEGPCRTVNTILNLYDCRDVNEFCKLFSIFPPEIQKNKNNDKLYLKFVDDLEPLDLFVGRRIGLSDKYPTFKEQPYRFVVMKDKIKKEKKNLIKYSLE